MGVTFKKSLKTVLLVGLLVSGLVVVKANANRVKDALDRVVDRVGDSVAHHVSDRISDRTVVRKFNKIYYDLGTYGRTWWLGIHSQQNPCDNWVMQEIITEVKPDFIIEAGTAQGGTTLFYAMVLEQVNPNGKVLTLDIAPEVEEASKFKIFQERVEVITGDDTSPEVVKRVSERVRGGKVLITLDSDHHKKHVLKELKAYAPLVSVGSYVVVQDTNVNGHPVLPEYGEGPYEAVQEFLKTNKNFRIDHSKEKFLLTFYPSGYLKRLS